MARRRGLVRTLVQAQRQEQLRQATMLREQARANRQAEQAHRGYERALAAAEKERVRLYVEAKQAQVARQNEQLEQHIKSLERLLFSALPIDPYIHVQALKQSFTLPAFNPGALGVSESPPQWHMYMPAEPKGIQKFLPGTKAKYAQAMIEAQRAYQAHIHAHATREAKRKQAFTKAKADYDRWIIAEQQRIAAQYAEIDAFEQNLRAGLPQAIVKYYTMILASSMYPHTFPHKVKLSYTPESKQLVVEYGLPAFEVVPEISSYKYVKTKDSIVEIARPETQRRALYTSIIAQITLRTLSELFRADRMKHLDMIVFNGYGEDTDKSTGHTVRACLVTVHTSRNAFTCIDLQQIPPQTCLTMLNASVSRNPSKLTPVRPILGFEAQTLHVQEHLIVEGREQSLMKSQPLPQVPANHSWPGVRPAAVPIHGNVGLNQEKIAELREESEQLQKRLAVEDAEEQSPFPPEPVPVFVASTGFTDQRDSQKRTQARGRDSAAENPPQIHFSVEQAEHSEQQFNSSPSIDRRIAVLKQYWHFFDEIHARQQTGMKPLWGLVEDFRVFDFEHRLHSQQSYQYQLYLQLLPSTLLHEIDQLWGTIMLPGWPERIVSEPFPHKLLAASFGVALKFWHGCSLTAWFFCEGPASRTDLVGFAEYYRKDVQALEEMGTPINKHFFDELTRAEARLGRPELSSSGTRRSGFEILRDIISFHRRQWADTYLDTYLRKRWEADIRETADAYRFFIDEIGTPPTAKQFAKVAEDVTNYWLGGNISGVYDAIQVQAPLQPQRIAILPSDRVAFAQAVFKILATSESDSPKPDDTKASQQASQPMKLVDDPYYQLNKLAALSFWYVQLEEALGHSPTLSNFGSSRFGQYSKALNSDINKAWNIFTDAIRAAKRVLFLIEVTPRPLQTRDEPARSVVSSMSQPTGQANLKAISKVPEEAEQVGARPAPVPTIQSGIQLDLETISRLREESERLRERLIIEAEEEQEQLTATPISTPAVPVVDVTTGSAPEVDEDWQPIIQQWKPEHWEIMRLLYQEQSAQLAMVARSAHRPLSLLIDEINAPVDEQLGDLLIDPETHTLSPHLQAIAERLIHWHLLLIR